MRALKPLVQAQLRPLALAVVALLGASAARAGLLEDDDARRAILELRQQRTQDGDALTAKLQELHAQIDGLKRSLLDMNAQIELVRSDLAKERGQNEVLARDLAEVQRRQKDMQQSMDERARKLEPVAVNLDGKAFKAEPEEKRQFDDALTKMRSQDYAAAAATLNALLQRYPATGYRESAHYWLGQCLLWRLSVQRGHWRFPSIDRHVARPCALTRVHVVHRQLLQRTQGRQAIAQDLG
jgi:TolA-binding protein